MNKTRRLTSLLLAVCMLVALLPAGMFTASAAVGDTYIYDFAGGLAASAGANTLNLISGDKTAFGTLSTYTGSTASWRLVRERTTTSFIQHNGSTQAHFGVFLFAGGENMDKYATFEINVPTAGTYTFDLSYYDYTSARECAVYLTAANSNHSVFFDVYEQIISINSGDMQYPSPGVDETKKSIAVQLAAGNYYLTFRPNTDYVKDHNYFMLHKLVLTKTAESGTPATKTLSIIGNTGSVLAVNGTRQLRALVPPHSVGSGYATQPAITWGSSKNAVATVSAGTVTAKAAGSAVITAQTGARREAVSVLVGDSRSQLYAVNEDAQNYMRTNNLTSVDIGKTFKDTYAYSTRADQWCFAHSSVSGDLRAAAYTEDANSWYGAFLDIQSPGRSVTFKIKVENDGNYLPDISYVTAGSSTGSGAVAANVYIYPTTYAAGSCPEESYVTYTGSGTSHSLIHAPCDKTLSLRAGEYYVTFRTFSETGRYVYLNHIALLYQGAYSNASVVERVLIDNPTPKMTAGDTTYKLGVKASPSTTEQTVTVWDWAVNQNKYISVKNGVLTADSKNKGSNVISATIGGREEVTSVSTGALLYTFNNVAKEYLAKNSLNSVAFNYFDDYSKITTGDNWVYVNQDITAGVPLPTAYQGMSANNNERYGVFLDFGKDNNKWIRFKIQVNKDGWYFPEVLYRDNGPANMRKTDVYISPTNVDPFTLQVMTVAPDANAGGVGTIKAKRCDESIYLAEGEYYLTFYTGSNDYVNDKGETPAHYLYLYHLALVEDDASIGILAPKAVVITKPEAAMKPLAVNDTVKLTARVLPINASQKIVSWKSSNTEVATVDSDGNVTAVGEGVTLITVTARDARSEAVVIQVGENAQVYAFNEVIKKYLEVDRGDDTIRRVDISTDSVFTSEGYLWQNTHPFGQGWRLVEKSSDSISTAYRGDSAQDDGDKDNTDPNYKYGLFLLSNNNDSYVRFEIDVEQDGEYATEIIQHLSMNASTTQGSRQTEIYISPIATPTEYLMHDAYYVGTTQLLSDTQRNTIVTDYGLNSQTFDSIQLKAGKYNLIIKSSGIIGRYIYLHAIALHRKGDFVAPSPVGVVFTNHADEVLYTSANATHNLNSMIHSLLSDQNVVWASDNTDVATVANGVITTKNVTEGTALITASSTVDGDIKGKVRVIIGQEAQPSYKYDFVGPIREIVTEEITDATNFNLFTEGYAGSYELANSYNGSAPWMLLDTTDEDSPYCSYTVSTHEQGYGLFVMNSTDVGETTQFKFKVLKDANYGAILNISNWSKGLDFEVYLAPAKATDPTSKRWLVANHEITKLENLTYGLELGELPLYAGEYILSIKSTKVNFVGTNGGLVSIHGLNLYRTGDIYYTIEGAQVRIEGQNAFGTFENQGIRFISTIYKSEFNVDSADVKEFGTVLFPKDFLNEDDDGSNLTVDYVGLNGATAACVPAKNRYLDTGDAVTFTAVLTGLKDTNYKRVFVARAYVILNDGTVLYGDTWTERSIYDVAKNGLDLEAAGEVTMSDKEKSALTAIVTTAK